MDTKVECIYCKGNALLENVKYIAYYECLDCFATFTPENYTNKLNRAGVNGKQIKWDLHWLDLAKFTARSSKDPSTKTGAVIISPKNTVVSTGYNGFAVGVEDSIERYNNRPLKYLMVCHCEMNAILFAKKDLENHTLYTYPFCSCSNCAKYVIQSGIKRCVAPILPSGELTDRWKEDTELAQLMFKESGVELTLLDYR